MKPAILFVNTGTGRNLGDRAMLLNLLDKATHLGAGLLLVPRQLPEAFRREFQAQPYTPYHECLNRFRRLPAGTLGQLLLMCCYVLHVCFMVLACGVCRFLPVPLSARVDEIQLLGHLRRVDAVWLNGGGYLTDKGKYECRCCLLTALFALIMGKKVILTGQGIGPVNTRITRSLLGLVARYATYVSVRDEVRSAELLSQLAGGKVPVVMAGDDASSLTTAELPARGVGEAGLSTIGPDAPRIALHFRISPFTENSQRLKQQFSETVAEVFARGWKPVFFIFTSQAEWEHHLLQELLVSAAPETYEIVVTDDPRVIKSQIGRCDIALGIAYHFIVFSLTTGTPVIALYGGEYYRYKMAGILKQYDKENWMTEFPDFIAKNTISALAGYLEERDVIHTQLRQQTLIITELHHQSIQNALGAISH